jgi:hypothetical protein
MVPEPSSMTPLEARDVLIPYLREAAGMHDEGAVRPTDSPLMKLGKQALPDSSRTSIRLFLTEVLRWRERKRSAGLSSPLRLHLGVAVTTESLVGRTWISSGMETSPSISPAPCQSNRGLRSASFRSTYWSTSRFGRALVSCPNAIGSCSRGVCSASESRTCAATSSPISREEGD